jgi:osmotically-inducible protein OsmY
MPVENERTLGERLDDLTIEASVKTALMLNENIRARDISVKSYRGEVSLSGLAHSAAEFELARKIADDVEGVISVKNTLTLSGGGVDSGETEPEKLDDSTIEAQVRAALMVNRNIDYTEIEVASREGVVTLSGMVRSGAEKDLVERIAESCWGVKKVANEVRIRQDT